jgi:chromosome segregation ATPase
VGIFRKPDDPIGEIEASLAQLHHRRDVLATKLAEAKIGCEKAEAAWQAALDGDDPKALEKAGARLLEAKELANLLEAELDDYARQIAIAETELSFAQDRAAREAKAARLDSQAAAIEPRFDDYAAAASRFGNELSKIEGLFDAEAAASIILQTSEAVLGAKQSILNQMRFLSAELRRDPPPRAPEPSPMPAGTVPRTWRALGERNDPHEPVW